MICVVIKGPSFEEAKHQIQELSHEVDLLEFRLDYFEHLNEEFLENLRKVRSLPVIFTLRDPTQESGYRGSEEQRLADIRRYAKLSPDYFDLESHCPPEYVETFTRDFPNVKVILSYHNFTETPDLDLLYNEMKRLPASIYKIAVMANNCLDACRILEFTRRADRPVCVMGMGESGEVTRILGKVFGSQFTYASASEKNQIVPGQLTARTLIDIYRYPILTAQTAVYGLIGNPVSGSIGYLTHNALFKELDIPAVYVKIPVNTSELKPFLNYARELGFLGISVTMPLKEDLLSLVDEIDDEVKKIGAANTLCFRNGKIVAFNTDSIGAIHALKKETEIKNKKILVIGAGGASKAIVVEALNQGGLVTVLNRDPSRAKEMAQKLPIKTDGLDRIASYIDLEGYDILINCTPKEVPFDLDLLLPNKVVMDIKTKPKDTELLIQAAKINCRIVYGYEMFIGQALEQFRHWFGGKIDLISAEKILRRVALSHLEADAGRVYEK